MSNGPGFGGSNRRDVTSFKPVALNPEQVVAPLYPEVTTYKPQPVAVDEAPKGSSALEHATELPPETPRESPVSETVLASILPLRSDQETSPKEPETSVPSPVAIPFPLPVPSAIAGMESKE